MRLVKVASYRPDLRKIEWKTHRRRTEHTPLEGPCVRRYRNFLYVKLQDKCENEDTHELSFPTDGCRGGRHGGRLPSLGIYASCGELLSLEGSVP